VSIAELVLAVMMALQPPGQSVYSQVVVSGPGAPRGCDDPGSLLCAPPRWSPSRDAWTRPETVAEGWARYRIIARAVTRETRGEPLLRRLVLTVTYHESGWRRDVHEGSNHLVRTALEDRGRSWCLGQHLLGTRSRRGRSLVGVSTMATQRCVAATASALRHAVDVCSARLIGGPTCWFSTYGGVAHPGPRIRARVATLARIERLERCMLGGRHG